MTATAPQDKKPSATQPTMAGGVLIALGFVGGAGVGMALGAPTLAALIGGGLGLAGAVLVAVLDRRRT